MTLCECGHDSEHHSTPKVAGDDWLCIGDRNTCRCVRWQPSLAESGGPRTPGTPQQEANVKPDGETDLHYECGNVWRVVNTSGAVVTFRCGGCGEAWVGIDPALALQRLSIDSIEDTDDETIIHVSVTAGT